MKEVWKDIEGYEGLYQVSNLGRVKRVKTDRILKGCKDKGGYLVIGLYKNNVMSTKTIHRLVAQAFIPNPENKPEVNHIDEDKANNKVNNLEWMTRKENNNHGTRNERISKTLSISISATNIKTGESIDFNSGKECARKLGLNPSHITAVLKGKRNHTGGYTFKYKENENELRQTNNTNQN